MKCYGVAEELEWKAMDFCKNFTKLLRFFSPGNALELLKNFHVNARELVRNFQPGKLLGVV